MNDTTRLFVQTANTAARFLLNKAFAIVFLIAITYAFLSLPKDPDQPVPFVEIYYAIILLGWVIVMAPLVRLLVFPEAATYAESGKLKEDLVYGEFRPGIVHYWFATLISYAAVLFTIATITK